jgi:predicted ATPase
VQATGAEQKKDLAVLTGGPCSGKTTLIQFLAETGYGTVSEAALTVIDQLNEQMGVAGQQQWRREHPLAFQERVLELQVRREGAAQGRLGSVVFVDRGRLDGLAYLQRSGVLAPAGFLKRCLQPRYTAVFLLSTLTRFQARPDTGRTESARGAQEIAAEIRQVYEANGYAVIEVPEMPVAKRAALVLRQIASLDHTR